METTKVINLKTGDEIYYSLSPEEAVKVAYLQLERKIYNTWDYPKIEVPLMYGKNTVFCGDFSALLSAEQRCGVA